ncbi:hypothetical protein BGX28_003863 [Mortierella sp. GBA30]|nr:hypothetical protein BGX28_003863 [Mortierella sp. GBA30]
MFRAISRGSAVVAALAQRQATVYTRHAAAAFHSSSIIKNNNSNNNNNNIPDMFASLLSKNSASSSNSSSRTTSSLFGNRRSSDFGASSMPLFGFSAPKANTTANPIHLDTNHPNEGRSFKVPSPAAVDQTYRRLRTVINQSNMKRELRLRRTYETGHVRMRRENQERNKKLFGAMVRKKIELIKLMKIRGM